MNVKIVPNEIALRPRFQLELGQPKEDALEAFEGPVPPPFVVNRSDDHVFIKFNRITNHFWSPQLHLEINELEEGYSRVYGLYGPNPTLWTFFIFLHFGLATLFVIFGVWAYSSAALDHSYFPQLVAMGLLVVLWFAFYAFGRAGKRKGKPQMLLLHQFMMEALGASVISADSRSAASSCLPSHRSPGVPVCQRISQGLFGILPLPASKRCPCVR